MRRNPVLLAPGLYFSLKDWSVFSGLRRLRTVRLRVRDELSTPQVRCKTPDPGEGPSLCLGSEDSPRLWDHDR